MSAIAFPTRSAMSSGKGSSHCSMGKVGVSHSRYRRRSGVLWTPRVDKAIHGDAQERLSSLLRD
jgi:hypothetical protein